MLVFLLFFRKKKNPKKAIHCNMWKYTAFLQLGMSVKEISDCICALNGCKDSAETCHISHLDFLRYCDNLISFIAQVPLLR